MVTYSDALLRRILWLFQAQWKKSPVINWWGSPLGSDSKESACQYRRCERHRFNTWVRRISWRRAWQPLLAGEFHGQRSLAAYSPWGHKELDTAERPTPSLSINWWYLLCGGGGPHNKYLLFLGEFPTLLDIYKLGLSMLRIVSHLIEWIPSFIDVSWSGRFLQELFSFPFPCKTVILT